MSEIPPPRYDSRRWTGDLDLHKPQPRPRSRHPKAAPLDPERVRAMGAPILLLLVLMMTAWLVDRAPGTVAPAFAVTVPVQYGRVMSWLNWAMVGAMGLLLLSCKVALPRPIRWMAPVLSMIALIGGFVECRLVAEARSHAVIRGPRHPMLFASTDDCGKGWRGGGSRSPGPCVHAFRLWDGRSAYDVTGRDYAKVRACVIVQRIADRSGFTWDEVVAQLDLRAETDDKGDITQDAQRDCVSGVSLPASER